MEKNLNDNKIVARKKGTVVSDAADKTIVVAVDTFKTHAKYRKKYTSTKRYRVHDEENKHKTGDTVEIVPCRPMSKSKKYKIA
ncbi:MAG: 30S ribosomal protein S17 [Candidatus Pacebacteria bacterium]|nr:30S ribosomal protein S17 [Candidatus Paceibacterota bacterium]MDR3583596.1 30S ribosomal protein S17 [Candidatus Paceibacterota bacterium]